MILKMRTVLLSMMIFVQQFLSSDRDSGSRPNFPKNRPKKDMGGAAGAGVYIRQEPFAKITFLEP